MKVSHSLIIICAYLLPLRASAQTNVSGTITQDAHWTLSGSPYTLTGTVGIISGITLTIDAGVQIKGNYDLLIKGALVINGSSSSHVSVQDTRVLFKSANLSLSTLNYVDFNQGGVQLADESEFNQDNPKNSATLVANYCTFNSNAFARTKGYQTQATLVLKKCTVNNSTVFGYYPRSEMIEIDSSALNTSTITSDSYNYGIKISGSTVSNCGLYIGCCGANFDISNTQITNGSISETNSYGVFKVDQSTLTNCNLNLPSTSVLISNCNITSTQNIPYLIIMNNGSITNSTLTGNSNLSLVKAAGNQYSSFDFENVTFNQFNVGLEVDNFSAITLTSCNFVNAHQYTVQNLSSKNINAQHNYWGTTNTSIIQNEIYDLYDNINYGIVDYSNFMLSPVVTNPVAAPLNLFKGLTNSGLQLSWTAPNDSKAVGYNIYKKTGTSSYTKIADAGNSTTYVTNSLSLQDEIVATSYTSFADGINDVLEGNESQYSAPAAVFFQTNISSSSVCSKDTVKVSVTKNFSFAPGKYFVLELAGSDGSFNKPILLDSISGSATLLRWVTPDSIKSQKKYKVRVISRQLSVFSQADSVKGIPLPLANFSYVIQKCPAGSVSVNYTKDQNASAVWNYGGGIRSDNNLASPFVVTWPSSGQKTLALTISSNGCSAQISKTFNLTIPAALVPPTICEVTVDSATFKNRIVWNYPKTNVLKFGIYRETEIANKFALIGTTSPQDQNSFIDLSSTPDQQAYRYSLSVFDSCGMETDRGISHKAIHLQISAGGSDRWNLNWSGYEGFPVTSYAIYRGTSINQLSLLSSVAADINSFTDLSPLPGDAFYQIRIAGSSCDIGGIESNTAIYRITEIESSLLSKINVYPNPVENLLMIQSDGDDAEKNFSITDVLGKQVLTGTLNSERSIATDHLTSGIYFVKVQFGSQSVVKKIIKN